MEKVMAFFKSEWMVRLYKILGYAVVEILLSQALLDLLNDRIDDRLVYGIVIVAVVQIANAFKKLLGEESLISKAL